MKTAPALALAYSLMLLTACQTHDRASAAADPVEDVSCGSIKQIHAVGDLYLAGQPSAADYQLLKDRGVRTVIDLRKPGENRAFTEARVVTDLGMNYMALPWNGPDELTDDKLDAMRKLLREADRPAVMKCGSSNRVGAGWLAYRVLDEGVAVDAALAEAKRVGMRTPAYETITLRYIEANQ